MIDEDPNTQNILFEKGMEVTLIITTVPPEDGPDDGNISVATVTSSYRNSSPSLTS